MQKSLSFSAVLLISVLATPFVHADIVLFTGNGSGTGETLYSNASVKGATATGTGNQFSYTLNPGTLTATASDTNSLGDSASNNTSATITNYSFAGNFLTLSGSESATLHATSTSTQMLGAMSNPNISLTFLPTVNLQLNITFTSNITTTSNYTSGAQSLIDSSTFNVLNETTGLLAPVTLDAQGHGSTSLIAGDVYQTTAAAEIQLLKFGNSTATPQIFDSTATNVFSMSISPVAAPEPSAWYLLTAGLVSLGTVARVRRVQE
jgi:hypothetical protein